MSNELIPIISEQKESRITPERRRVVEKSISKGQVSFLSPDKEGGPFHLFQIGNSLEVIAEKTSYPLDVIYATAVHYQWEEKLKDVTSLIVSEVPSNEFVKQMQADFIKTLLVATYKREMKELGDIIAGRKDAKNNRLLPNNLHGLEKLINMVTAETTPPKETQQPVNGGTIIQGQNVQVIQNTQSPNNKISKEERDQMLELLESEVD